jgi:uncharacterized membrane protein YjfL (UPF0719 family)
MKRYFAFVLATLALPSFAFAASFKELTGSLVQLVNTAVVPFMYSIAFVCFLIGMVRFFFIGGEENRTKGKQFMLWGIIGFVVLFSVWGIVNLLLTALPSGV